MDVFRVHTRLVEVLQEVAGSVVVVCRLSFTYVCVCVCVCALLSASLALLDSTICSLLRCFISKER